MSYESRLQVLEDVIRVDVRGHRSADSTVANAGQIGRDVVEKCRESGIDRILLVLYLSGRFSPLEAFEMVSDAMNYGWSYRFRLAIVNLDAASLDDTHFTETIAVNRCFDMKVFDNEHDGLEWLRETQSA